MKSFFRKAALALMAMVAVAVAMPIEAQAQKDDIASTTLINKGDKALTSPLRWSMAARLHCQNSRVRLLW